MARGRYCDSCEYAAYKGEPVFGGCSRCTKDTCDKCGKELHQPFLTVNGKDYHSACFIEIGRIHQRRAWREGVGDD